MGYYILGILTAVPLCGLSALLLWSAERSGIKPRRGGFTTANVLVAMTIIAILAALSWPALQRAMETSKVAKTQAALLRVQKAFDEAYYAADRQEWRMPPEQIRQLEFKWKQHNPPQDWPAEKRRIKMAQHLPSHWGEAVYAGLTFHDYYLGFGDPIHLKYRAYLWGGCRNVHEWSGFHAKKSPAGHRLLQHMREAYGTEPGAECYYRDNSEVLWAVLTLGYPHPELRDLDGDADGDSFREFQDGWGRPLRRIGNRIWSAGPDGRWGTKDDMRAGQGEGL